MRIFKNEYSSNIGKQFTYLIFIIVISVLFMLAFPIINDPSVESIVESSIQALPEKLTNLILPLGDGIFKNLSLYHITILIFVQFMISVFSLNIGLLSLAKEQGFGTIEYIYINPVSRIEIVISKFFSNILNILVLTALSFVVTTYIYSYVGKIDFMDAIEEFYIIYIIIFFEALLFLSLGTMVSSLFKRTSSVSYASSFIIVFLLVMNMLLSLKVINFGLINQFIPLRTLQEISFSLIINIIKMLFITKIPFILIFFLIGILVYNKKDLIV